MAQSYVFWVEIPNQLLDAILINQKFVSPYRKKSLKLFALTIEITVSLT
jgi:hypothetical protein